MNGLNDQDVFTGYSFNSAQGPFAGFWGDNGRVRGRLLSLGGKSAIPRSIGPIGCMVGLSDGADDKPYPCSWSEHRNLPDNSPHDILAGRLPTSGGRPGSCNDLNFWHEATATVGGFEGIRIFDISNPADPQLVTDIPPPMGYDRITGNTINDWGNWGGALGRPGGPMVAAIGDGNSVSLLRTVPRDNRSEVLDRNNLGWMIVVWYPQPDQPARFMGEADQTLINMNPRLPPGWTSFQPFILSQGGQAGGYAFFNGQPHGVIVTPVGGALNADQTNSAIDSLSALRGTAMSAPASAGAAAMIREYFGDYTSAAIDQLKQGNPATARNLLWSLTQPQDARLSRLKPEEQTQIQNWITRVQPIYENLHGLTGP